MSLISIEHERIRIFRRLSRLALNVFSRWSLSTKHVREAYADCAIAFNAEIASSPYLTAAASGALVGSNVITGVFSRSSYVGLDDIFGQVRFPFSCFFLSCGSLITLLFRRYNRNASSTEIHRKSINLGLRNEFNHIYPYKLLFDIIICNNNNLRDLIA